MLEDLSEPIFDFGEVLVGKNGDKKFVLHNPSPVHANFKIKYTDKNTDPYFSFSHMEGTIPSGKKMEITVRINMYHTNLISFFRLHLVQSRLVIFLLIILILLQFPEIL
jgi:hypothetical protein